MHRALTEVFDALERAGVSWSLLRVPAMPEAPTGDVDLLVDPAQVDALRDVLARHDFVPVPGWQRLPTLLFVRYDEATAHCLLLDVTGEVAFGRGGVFRTDARADLLARSTWTDGARVLSPEDGFWALLLHCLLDKGRVPEHYRARLQAGAGSAGTGAGPLLAPLGAQAAALRDHAARGDWSALEAAAAGVAEQWRGQLSLPARPRPAPSRLRRLLPAPRLPRRGDGGTGAPP